MKTKIKRDENRSNGIALIEDALRRQSEAALMFDEILHGGVDDAGLEERCHKELVEVRCSLKQALQLFQPLQQGAKATP